MTETATSRPMSYGNGLRSGLGMPEIFYGVLFLLLYVSVALAIGIEWESGFSQHFYLDWVASVALVYFLFLLIASWQSLRVFYLLCPLVVLTVPNSLNDLFPSYAMGPPDELGAAYLAFFTHIDIYFLCGLIVHRSRQNKRSLQAVELLGVSVLVLCYAAGYLHALIDPTRKLGGFVVWGFQYRYLFLAIAFISLPAVAADRNRLLLTGIFVSALLVVLESMIFTELRVGSLFSDRLTSGNYGYNAYGNLLAAISVSCYIQYYLTDKTDVSARRALLVLFSILTAAAFFTDTRMSSLSLLFGLTLFHIVGWRRFGFSPIAAVAIIMFLLISPLMPSNMLGVGDYLLGLGKPEDGVVTAQAATIQTRVILWQGSLQMIRENPLLGVGLGEWNFVKADYDIDWKILLDSHNDYLQFLAEFGLLLGLLFPFVLYFLPWLKAIMVWLNDTDQLIGKLPFLAIPMTMAFSAMSNSNGHKHQIFMILALLALACLSSKDRLPLHARGGAEEASQER